MKDGGVQIVFNTTEGAQSIADSRAIRALTLIGTDPLLHHRRRRPGGGAGDAGPAGGGFKGKVVAGIGSSPARSYNAERTTFGSTE